MSVNAKKSLMSAVWGLVVLFCGILSFAQDPLSRLQELPTNQDTVKVDNQDLSLVDLDKAIRDSEEMLDKYPNSDFTPNLMFQLAELYVKKSRVEFDEKMKKYEDLLKKYDAGILQEEPEQPNINFQPSIALCQRILQRYPNVDFKDKVLYRLAMCYQEEGDREKAKDSFQRLISETPESGLVAEAYFRIGEYYFDTGKYHQAIDAYKHVLDTNRWESLFFDASLYKLGWSYYKINNFSDAISTFVYLLDDIKTLEETDVKILDRTIADLKKEALDYVAISFSEYGGAEKAKEFFAAIGERNYAVTVFHKLGNVFYGQNRFVEAIATYETLLELYPLYQKAPQIRMQIVTCYEKQWDYEGANQARETLVRDYGPGSKWLDKVKDEQLRTETLALVEGPLLKIGIYHQKRAMEGIDSTAEYTLAINSYKKFLQYFPLSPKSYEANYYLAECFYELGDYAAAAIEYKKVMENYEEKKYLEDAAYSRVLSFDKLLQQSNASSPTTFPLQNLFGEVDTLLVEHRAQMELILACNDFADLLPESSKAPQVLSKEAEVFYDLARFDLARRVYLKIWQDYPESEYGQRALLMVAQCYFSEGEFVKAEEHYAKVLATLSDTSEIGRKAQKMVASSGFKRAESLKEQGDTLAAAQKFEEVGLQYLDLDVSEAAIFEAVSLYELLGKKDHAAHILEQFTSVHPSSHLVDEALVKAATLRRELQQWESALTSYLKLTKGNSSPEIALMALFSAGVCYKNLKKWKQAKEIFEQYVSLYRQGNLDRYVEALFRIGEAEFELGNHNEALRAFSTALDAYDKAKNSGETVADYYAANAKFMIGEIHYQQYAQIELVPPLKVNLKRKRSTFNTVIKDYAEAAKYGIAEWTTAASYRIGMAFEEFNRALLASVPPPGLSPEQLEAYETNLRQIALPMQKKALEVYKTNVQRADEIGIDNVWIQKSRERLSSLQAELSQQPLGEKEKITSNE